MTTNHKTKDLVFCLVGAGDEQFCGIITGELEFAKVQKQTYNLKKNSLNTLGMMTKCLYTIATWCMGYSWPYISHH
jgi:hypothetical protein